MTNPTDLTTSFNLDDVQELRALASGHDREAKTGQVTRLLALADRLEAQIQRETAELAREVPDAHWFPLPRDPRTGNGDEIRGWNACRQAAILSVTRALMALSGREARPVKLEAWGIAAVADRVRSALIDSGCPETSQRAAIDAVVASLVAQATPSSPPPAVSEDLALTQLAQLTHLIHADGHAFNEEQARVYGQVKAAITSLTAPIVLTPAMLDLAVAEFEAEFDYFINSVDTDEDDGQRYALRCAILKALGPRVV